MSIPDTSEKINWGITYSINQQRHKQLIQGTSIDFEGFEKAQTGEKLRALWHIEQQIDIFSTQTLKTISNLALHDSDSNVLAEGCHLINIWSDVNYDAATIFVPRIEQISREDSSPWVRKNALDGLRKLSILKDGKINLVTFALEEVSSKFNILREVSSRVADFNSESIQTLIDYSLHDPEPIVRGTGVQLLRTCISATRASNWIAFQSHIQWMTFHDPNLWVRKHSVVVAQKLYRAAFINHWTRFVLIYCILIAVINTAAASALISNSRNLRPLVESACIPISAQSVFSSIGTNNESFAIGRHDNRYSNIGSTEDSILILDMGQEVPIVDRSGPDFYYFERLNGPGINIDNMMVSVAVDDGSGKLDMNSIHPVFIWGDSDIQNNGNIPLKYFTNGSEPPNLLIEAGDLFNKSAIGIDITDANILTYRYIIIQPYPPHPRVQQDDLYVEIDSIETICAPPTPTSTSSITQTPSPTTVSPSDLTATQAAILSQTPSPTTVSPSDLTATQAAILSQTPSPTTVSSSDLTATQAAILSQTPSPTTVSPSDLTATQAAILSQTPSPTTVSPSDLTATQAAILSQTPSPTTVSPSDLTATQAAILSQTPSPTTVSPSDLTATQAAILSQTPSPTTVSPSDLTATQAAILSQTPSPTTVSPSDLTATQAAILSQTPSPTTVSPSDLTATQAAILSQTPSPTTVSPSDLTATQAAILSQTPSPTTVSPSDLTATQAAILSQTPSPTTVSPSDLTATQAAILSQTQEYPSNNNPLVARIIMIAIIVPIAIGLLLLRLMELMGEMGLDNQKKQLFRNRNIVHPLVGQLPILDNRKRIILRELKQRQTIAAQYTTDDLPDNLAQEINQLNVQLKKIEAQLRAIRDSNGEP